MSNDDENLYRILGLEPGASIAEIKEAWRELVKVWHPDRFVNDPKMQKRSHEKLKEINGAYEILAKKIIQKSVINDDLLPKSGRINHKPKKYKSKKIWIISLLFLGSLLVFIFNRLQAARNQSEKNYREFTEWLEKQPSKSDPRNWKLYGISLGMTEEDLLVERGRPLNSNKKSKDEAKIEYEYGSKVEEGWLAGTVKFSYGWADSLSDAWLKDGIVVAIQVHPEYLEYKTWDEWGDGEFGIPKDIQELKVKFGEPTSTELNIDKYERIYIWRNHGVFGAINAGKFEEFGIYSPDLLN